MYRAERQVEEQKLKLMQQMQRVQTGLLDPNFFQFNVAKWTRPTEPVRLRGEGIVRTMTKVVNMRSLSNPVPGYLYLTNYRIIFAPYASPTQSDIKEAGLGSDQRGGDLRVWSRFAAEAPLTGINEVAVVGGPHQVIQLRLKHKSDITLAFRHEKLDLEKFTEFSAQLRLRG